MENTNLIEKIKEKLPENARREFEETLELLKKDFKEGYKRLKEFIEDHWDEILGAIGLPIFVPTYENALMYLLGLSPEIAGILGAISLAGTVGMGLMEKEALKEKLEQIS